jgi:uncharacterized protein YjbI with pentapeptide repeats
MSSIENLPMPNIARLAQGAPGTVPDNFDPNSVGGGSGSYYVTVGTGKTYVNVAAALAANQQYLYIEATTTDGDLVITAQTVSIIIKENVTWFCDRITALDGKVNISSFGKRSGLMIMTAEEPGEAAIARFASLDLENITLIFNLQHNVDDGSQLLVVYEEGYKSNIKNCVIASNEDVNPNIFFDNVTFHNTVISVPYVGSQSLVFNYCNFNNLTLDFNEISPDTTEQVLMYESSGSFYLEQYQDIVGEGVHVKPELYLTNCHFQQVTAIYGYPQFHVQRCSIDNFITVSENGQSSLPTITSSRCKLSNVRSANIILDDSFNLFMSGFLEDIYVISYCSRIYLTEMYISDSINVYDEAYNFFISNCYISDDIVIRYPETNIVQNYVFDANNLPFFFIGNWHINNTRVDDIRVRSRYDGDTDASYNVPCYLENWRMSNCTIDRLYVEEATNSDTVVIEDFYVTNCEFESVYVYRLDDSIFTNCYLTEDDYFEIRGRMENTKFIGCKFTEDIYLMPQLVGGDDTAIYYQVQFIDCRIRRLRIDNILEFSFVNCEFTSDSPITTLVEYCTFTNCSFRYSPFYAVEPDNFHLLTDEQKETFYLTPVVQTCKFQDCEFGTYNDYQDPYIMAFSMDNCMFYGCRYLYNIVTYSITNTQIHNCYMEGYFVSSYPIIGCDINNLKVLDLEAPRIATTKIRNSNLEDIVTQNIATCVMENVRCLNIIMTYDNTIFNANIENNTLFDTKMSGCHVSEFMSVPGIRSCNIADTFIHVIQFSADGVETFADVNGTTFRAFENTNFLWISTVNDVQHGFIGSCRFIGCKFHDTITTRNFNNGALVGCNLVSLNAPLDNIVFTGCYIEGVVADEPKTTVSFSGCTFEVLPAVNGGDSNVIYNGCVKRVIGSFVIHPE